MPTDPQIKILDYRNACFQGTVKDGMFEGLGLLLTQDFMFCAAVWSRGNLSGPCFSIFPNEKIMYGDFENNNAQGLICYELSKECQLYCPYRQGKMGRHIAAAFPYIECVLEIELTETDVIRYQKEHDYVDNAEKWEIMEQIFKNPVPDFMRGHQRFLKSSFLSRYKEVEDILGDEYFFGAKGEGLGIKMNLQNKFIQSMGYFNRDKVLSTIGKITINNERRVKQEGLYDKPETLIRYQERPLTNKKHYRNHFRYSINFQNSFIQLTSLQKMEKEMLKLRDNIKENTTKRIAQQLIEHIDFDQFDIEGNPRDPRDREKDRSFNRGKFQPARMMNDVTLDQLKDELNRSMSLKKGKTSVSPYKQFDLKPAQLKYTSRTGKKTETHKPLEKDLSKHYSSPHIENPNQDPSHYGSRNYSSPTEQQQPKYRDVIRRLNFDQETQHKPYQPKAPEPKRYPIEQNLRPYNRNNTSKSPIKLENRPFRYQYVEEDVNPQRKDYLKERPYTRPDTRPDRSLSPVDAREYTPNRRNRLDRLSNMYDEMQDKSKLGYENEPEKKYTLNHGRGYQFSEDEFETKMGLVRTGRKVETYHTPVRKPTVSPYKPQQRSTAEFNYRSPYENNYDRQRFNEPSEYDRRGADRKTNYGYFDKNR